MFKKAEKKTRKYQIEASKVKLQKTLIGVEPN